MRVKDSQTSNAVLRHFDDIRMRSSRNLRETASGEKITRASDDIVGFHKTQKLRAQIDGAQRAAKNAQDAFSLVQVADAGLESIVDVLQKARALALYSANDAQSADDRETLEKEFSLLMEEIDRQSDGVSYNGKKLLDGSQTDPLSFHVGANESDVIEVDLPTVTQTSLGLDGLSVDTRENAEATLTRFDEAIRSLSEKRAELGAISERLNHAENYVQTLRENNTGANSKIKDLDLAEGVERLSKNKVLIETAASALSKSSLTNSVIASLAPLG